MRGQRDFMAGLFGFEDVVDAVVVERAVATAIQRAVSTGLACLQHAAQHFRMIGRAYPSTLAGQLIAVVQVVVGDIVIAKLVGHIEGVGQGEYGLHGGVLGKAVLPDWCVEGHLPLQLVRVADDAELVPAAIVADVRTVGDRWRGVGTEERIRLQYVLTGDRVPPDRGVAVAIQQVLIDRVAGT